jgi:sulfate adenylyltransferase subunit 1
VKQTTRTMWATTSDIPYSISITVRSRTDRTWTQRSGALNMNDLGRVVLRVPELLALDDYRDNRRTGSSLVIDPADGATPATGVAGEAPASFNAESASQPEG